ncbi:MAG: DNA translocase FtsK, partial [Deltaproteobacteria bacterium]|nr:DNA translocase FtsK [Deltaproteobacteria bacterium]
ELQQRSIGVGNRKKAGINLKALINPENGANWLAVIDRAHGTLELPGDIGRRLAWYSVQSRTLSVHTNERDWRQYWHEQLKTTLTSLGLPELVTTGYIQNCLLEIFPVLPEGLLTVIDQSEPGESIALGKAFSQSALGKLLSIIITLRWYRSDKPGLVLVPIDGGDFRNWYHENEPSKFTESAVHFIAMWLVQEKLYADILTIHPCQTSFDGNLPDLSEAKANFQQLANFARTLESLFVGQADANILTPLRRALLRERLSIAVFATPQTASTPIIGQRKDTKIRWANAINKLFTEYIPQIRLLDVRVALQEANHPPDEQQSYYEHELDPYQRVIVKLPGTLLRPISAPTVVESQQELTTIPKVMETQIPFPLNGRKSEQPQKQLDVFPLPETEPGKTVSSEQTDVTLQEDIQKQAEQLRRVLIAYGIAIAGIDTEKTQIGPRFIRYWVKLQPPAGRLSEVQKFAVDIARELGSNTVPFIDNIPGERYIGIDLVREHPETISLIPILDNLPAEQPYELIIAGGQNAAGEDVPFDIVRLPHILVAGSTGSGKTVFLSSLIMSLAWRHSANDIQLLLIDPKQTDFVVFSELPHLHDKRIYYEPEEAVTVLRELISNEKEHRTKLLHQSRCPNILEYNRRNPPQRLPWIVVVIDEFADIILTLSRRERGEFERQINRLAGTGRSVGIHLVLATQRPTTDVVTGTIKANIPARVSFRLPSVTDSRTILDRPGAENLLGRGDMLISVNGKIQRLQGYNVSYDELTQLLLQIK